jgi:valyl-tRNA synthetase
LWLTIPHDGPTIMTANWPDSAEIPVYREQAQLFETLQRTVERLRNLRAEIGLQPRDVLALDMPARLPDALASLVATYAGGSVTPQPAQGQNEAAGTDGQSVADLLTAVRGIAPKGVLAQRYKKEATRLRGEVERGRAKLADERFVANAKPHVVAKEREKLEGYCAQLARVEAAIEEMGVTG